MIKFSKGIYPDHPTAFMFTGSNELVVDLDEQNLKVYYWCLFRNRTVNNKKYVSKYSSLKELREDIYGECYFAHQFYYDKVLFKDIYKQLDKQLLLSKINDMIARHGNMIVINDRAICIKTDEDIRPYDYVKNLCPDKEVLSFDTLERIYELGLWENT